VIDAYAPRDRIDPRQKRLAQTVGVPYAMYSQPCLLKGVISVRANCGVGVKEAMQLRADAIDQAPGCGEVTRLVAGHEGLQFLIHIHVYSLQSTEKLRTTPFLAQSQKSGRMP
jgi:hypothetical protein